MKQDSRSVMLPFRQDVRVNNPQVPVTAAPRQTARWKRVVSAGFQVLVWTYLLLLLAFWLVLYFAGDRWWLATVALFGPRSVWGLPLLVLLPMAAVWRRWLLVPLAVGVIVFVGPIMGYCVPWERLAGANGPTIRVLTCNIDGANVHAEDLRALVQQTKPDIISLQEFKGDQQWLLNVLPAGFHAVCDGELAVASPYPLVECSRRTEITKQGWEFCDGICCEMQAPGGSVYICCMHLLTPRRGLGEVLDRMVGIAPTRAATLQTVIERRRGESAVASQWVSGLPRPLVLTGDFNMPVDSRIYRQYWSDYSNAFSQAGLGFGDTKITSLGRFSYGLRIDHILYEAPWRAVRAWIGRDVGSDHVPLLADLEWKPSPGKN
jgi:vancomycin resistance protein VanJ